MGPAHLLFASARNPSSRPRPAAAAGAAIEVARSRPGRWPSARSAPLRCGDAMAAAEPASSGQPAPEGQGQGQRPQPPPSQAQPPPPQQPLGGGGGGSSRHEKSLGLLTTKFVSLLQEAKDGVLDLKAVSVGGGEGADFRSCGRGRSPSPCRVGRGTWCERSARGSHDLSAVATWPAPRPWTSGWGGGTRDQDGPDQPLNQWGPAPRRALDKEPRSSSARAWLLSRGAETRGRLSALAAPRPPVAEAQRVSGRFAQDTVGIDFFLLGIVGFNRRF